LHQVLHELHQLMLVVLQEAGVAAQCMEAALQAGEGLILAAQHAPQPLLLVSEAGQLLLLLCLQDLQPRLQSAVGWDTQA
jgi:hypothetical protein